MHLYFDMDGVFADFFTAVEKLQKVDHYSKANLTDTLQKIRGTNFFGQLPKLPNTDYLISSAVEIFGEYSILSTPLSGDVENTIRQKKIWIGTHLKIKPKHTIFTSDKHDYAFGNILVDDYKPNIDRWVQHGGIGIKYKALSKNYTVHDILKQLRNYKNENK
jgi:hypothetical protein